jgi:hypothetical protein
MAAPNPGAGEVINPGYHVNGKTEMDFYHTLNLGNNYQKASPEEKTLFNILKARVSIYGEASLSRTSMYPPSVVGGGTKPILPYGSAANPGVHQTMQEAERAMTFHNLKEVAPGLYQEQSLQNGYVFILSKPSKKVPKNNHMPSPTPSPTPYTPPVINPPTIDPWGSVKRKKPEKPVMKKVAQDYDLLFNALEYLTTYESEIEKLTMELVNSGDDILTNYNYESIDFLPDVDIEVRTVNGEYVNSISEFIQTERSEFINSIVDESESSEDIQLVNELISYIEDRIGVGTPYGEIINYFGKYDNSTNKFKKSTPRGSVLDFFMEIPEKFQDLDVEIRFDVI